MSNRIDSFTGSYHWLSNFAVTPFIWQGVRYLTVEHAFQAEKTLDPEWRRRITASTSPTSAKRMGRKCPMRKDWDSVKDGVMHALVSAKFNQNPELARRLVDTGSADLVEGNTWGDTYWGVCQGVGENRLGKTLMAVRASLGDATPSD